MWYVEVKNAKLYELVTDYESTIYGYRSKEKALETARQFLDNLSDYNDAQNWTVSVFWESIEED